MNPLSIFSRTAKGEQEVQGSAELLERRFRRFLALVDGERSVAELRTVSRPSELDEVLNVLLEGGYIELSGAGTPGIGAAEDDDPFAAAALTPQMFGRIKARAAEDLGKRAGAAADPVINRILACDTPVALRVALRDAGAMLGDTLGADAAREFLQGVGRNLIA